MVMRSPAESMASRKGNHIRPDLGIAVKRVRAFNGWYKRDDRLSTQAFFSGFVKALEPLMTSTKAAACSFAREPSLSALYSSKSLTLSRTIDEQLMTLRPVSFLGIHSKSSF